MSNRYLLAALLMTSCCVASAHVVPARQITGIRAGVQADAVVVAPSTGTQLPGSVADEPAALPPAASEPAQDPIVLADQPVTGAQPSAAALPEPSSIALMAVGLFGAMGLRRRRAK